MTQTEYTQDPAARKRDVRPRPKSREKRASLLVYLPLAVTFAFLGVFYYYPAAEGISKSFYNWNPGFNSPFVGFANFRTMLSDSLWWASVGRIGKFLLWGVTLGWVFPLLAAECIIGLSHRGAQTLFRSILIIPLAFPVVVNVLIWGFIFDPNVGIVNSFLRAIGLDSLAHNWLGDPHTALYSLIAIGFPWVASLPFLIFLGALQGIPREIFEAAAVDGAGRWRRFIFVDLPLLRSQFVLLLVVAIIQILQYGVPAQLLTQGGPAFATTVPVLRMLSAAFLGGDWGYAAALSSTLFLIILALSAAVAWVSLGRRGNQTARGRGIRNRRQLIKRLAGGTPASPGATQESSITRLARTPQVVESQLEANHRHARTTPAEVGAGELRERASAAPQAPPSADIAPSRRRRSTAAARRRRADHTGWAILGVLAFVGIFPYLFMLVASLKDNNQFYGNYWTPSFPLHFENYTSAWDQTHQYLVSTLIVATLSILGVVVLSTVTAFVFARYEFVGRHVLFGLIAILMMVPNIALLVPLFVVIKHLHLLNTYWALIFPYVATGTVLGTILMRVFIDRLPKEIFDAARVDGANGMRVLRHVVVPLSLPMIGTITIFTAINVWSDYFWPSLTITSDHLRTIGVGLAYFQGQQVTNWGPLFAGYTIASVPLVILFAVASRFFLAGLQGGVRGSG